MPSNSEMYERGAYDAEHDELNPFYYQHYYYYRRGYDDMRRRSRAGGRPVVPLLLLAVLVLALGGGAWWLLGRGRTPAEAQTSAAAPTAAPTAPPTPRPTLTAAPTAAPTVAPALGIGARARIVNLNGAPLRARSAPGLQASVVARIPEGSEVTLLDGPAEADGYTWWQVEAEGASGWVAAGSPEGVAFLEAIP